jgi:hypothetical protein
MASGFWQAKSSDSTQQSSSWRKGLVNRWSNDRENCYWNVISTVLSKTGDPCEYQNIQQSAELANPWLGRYSRRQRRADRLSILPLWGREVYPLCLGQHTEKLRHNDDSPSIRAPGRISHNHQIVTAPDAFPDRYDRFAITKLSTATFYSSMPMTLQICSAGKRFDFQRGASFGFPNGTSRENCT